MDWRDVVRQVAPGVAALAGGPLAGGVVKVLAENILGNPDASEDDLTQAMAGGLTPEMRQAILLSQQQLGLEETKAYLGDVADARRAHGGNDALMPLSYVVLGAWTIITGGTLLGLFQLATGGIQLADVGLAATVFTLLGSLVGYVSNAAQQILGYWFGSSRGSAEKTAALAASVKAPR